MRVAIALSLTAASLLTIFCFNSNVYAASTSPVDVFQGVCSGGGSNSTVCKENTDSKAGGEYKNPIYGSKGILSTIINLLSIIVGIVAVIGIMMAGFKFITSGSNPQQVTVAREMVLYAAVGLIVAAFAQVLVRFIIDKG